MSVQRNRSIPNLNNNEANKYYKTIGLLCSKGVLQYLYNHIMIKS